MLSRIRREQTDLVKSGFQKQRYFGDYWRNSNMELDWILDDFGRFLLVFLGVMMAL